MFFLDNPEVELFQSVCLIKYVECLSFLFLILAFSNCFCHRRVLPLCNQFYNSVTKTLNKFYKMQGLISKLKIKNTELDFSKGYYMFQLYLHV